MADDRYSSGAIMYFERCVKHIPIVHDQIRSSINVDTLSLRVNVGIHWRCVVTMVFLQLLRIQCKYSRERTSPEGLILLPLRYGFIWLWMFNYLYRRCLPSLPSRMHLSIAACRIVQIDRFYFAHPFITMWDNVGPSPWTGNWKHYITSTSTQTTVDHVLMFFRIRLNQRSMQGF